MLVYGWTLANSNSIYQRSNRSISHLLADVISKEISTKGVDIEDEVLSNDFYEIMENNNNVMFKKTKKLANGNPNTIKYHPLMIRFCISLAAKSASAYDELRSCGILNCKVEELHVITQILLNPLLVLILKLLRLINQSSTLVGYQRYMCLSFDEMNECQ